MQRELGYITDLHQGYFDNSVSPSGEPWARNRPSTISRKGHSKVLRGIPKYGFPLQKSLTLRATQSVGDAIREAIEVANGGMITFGDTLFYSEINSVNRQARDGSTIPAR